MSTPPPPLERFLETYSFQNTLTTIRYANWFYLLISCLYHEQFTHGINHHWDWLLHFLYRNYDRGPFVFVAYPTGAQYKFCFLRWQMRRLLIVRNRGGRGRQPVRQQHFRAAFAPTPTVMTSRGHTLTATIWNATFTLTPIFASLIRYIIINYKHCLSLSAVRSIISCDTTWCSIFIFRIFQSCIL